MDLHKLRPEDSDMVKGQIMISISTARAETSGRANSASVAASSRTGSGPETTTTTTTTGVLDANNNSGELPEGWTECRTANGRLYYMNHVTRTTHWHRPTQSAAAMATSIKTSSALNRSTRQHRQRDSAASGHHQTQSSIDSTGSVNSIGSASGAGAGGNASTQSRSSHQRRSTRHRNYLARNQLHDAVVNALQAAAAAGESLEPTGPLPMPAGFELRTTSQGQVYFHYSETGTSTWIDPRVPRELLSMDLNLDELIAPLAPNWEVRHTNNGRRYYVDHVSRTTQFTDPRLVSHAPTIVRLLKGVHHQRRSHSIGNLLADVGNAANLPPLPPPSTSSTTATTPAAAAAGTTTTTNGKVNTAGNDLQVLKNGIASLPSSQQAKRRNLVQKLSTLRQELQAFQPQSGHCRIEVSREDIFEDSYRAILKMRPKDLRKRLMIKFRGEEGLDYGGIAREWLYLLSHEMLNPYYGLFQYTRDDIYTLQINPDSSINPVS